jgi:hypothetical protein
MAGHFASDGSLDNLFKITTSVTNGYYYCPSLQELDLMAQGKLKTPRTLWPHPFLLFPFLFLPPLPPVSPFGSFFVPHLWLRRSGSGSGSGPCLGGSCPPFSNPKIFTDKSQESELQKLKVYRKKRKYLLP